MVDSVAKLLAVVMVVIAGLAFLGLFGDGVAAGVPMVVDFVGNAIAQLWGALERIVDYQS